MKNPKETCDQASAPIEPETPEARVVRLYQSPGGPLVGWLEDEARRRGQTFKNLADQLGVTYGYVAQLRRGIRPTNNLTAALVQNCAQYLCVPAIVVKLLAGIIDIRDFAFPRETEEQQVQRALRQVLDDPKVRASVPVQMEGLPFEAKKALVLLHAQTHDQDILRVQHLPTILRWLQRAAQEHNESELEAYRGQPC
jgi:transcriptional regulator with XRE-family HTH domain